MKREMGKDGGDPALEVQALRRRCEELERKSSELQARLAMGRESEALLSSILDTVPDFVLKVSPEGTIQFVNRVVPELDPAKVVGANLRDFTSPEWHEPQRQAIERAMSSGETVRFQVEGLGPHGRKHRYFSRVVPLQRAGNVEALILIATDVTELHAARAELQQSADLLELAAASAGVGLWGWERATDLIHWDEAACQIFGRERAPASFDEYLEQIHPEDRQSAREHVERALRTGHFDDYELRIVRPDGSERWIMGKGKVVCDADGAPVRLLGGILDNTEQRQLQDELQQTRKMDAVGQLAAGIAHNFNNMLTVILSSSELAARRAGPEVASLLEEGRQAVLRAAQMVRQLMLFSGKGQKPQPRDDDIAAIVRRSVGMCRAAFGKEVAIELGVPPDVGRIRCDAVQIEQALLNVLINARDALEGIESRPRRIGVRIDKVVPEEGKPHWVRIEVSDNGAGMADDVRRRALEPFFSTKEPGRGTGLGLSTTYAIIKEHAGRVELESAKDVGTKVRLLLPVHEASAEAAVEVQGPVPPPGNGERVLLVDDEPLVRDSVARVLAEAGYRVETAADGSEALSMLSRSGAAYDVVLLDQSMPGLSGRQVLKEIRALVPALPVIWFTGYPSSREQADAVLEKPVTGVELLRTVHAVLGATKGSPP